MPQVKIDLLILKCKCHWVQKFATDKGLVSRTYKEFSELIDKKTTQFKNGTMTWRYFSEEDLQKANNLMKRCSASLVTKEMQNQSMMRQSLWKILWQFFETLEQFYSYNSVPLYVPRRTENLCPHKACMRMFITALFVIGNKWKQLKCPSIDEWINTLWYTYEMLHKEVYYKI